MRNFGSKIVLALSVLTFAAAAVVVWGCYEFVNTEFPDVSILKTRYPVVHYEGKKVPPTVTVSRLRPSSWASLGEISRVAVGAIVVSEDWAFYQHKGYDANQIKEAIKEDWEEGRFARGASTITQQVVRSKEADVSIINFSIGSPTAALIIEVLSVLDPTAVLFLGMTGGLHRSLKLGDFILPTAAIRDEGASRHFMPTQVPALPTFKIQKFVSQIIVEKGLDYRTGVVHTTDYRFWEFDDKFKAQLYEEHALVVDMETATLFVAGFACKVPIGALLLVSDLPLQRGGIKTKKSAKAVFSKYTDLHLEIGMKSMSEIAERGEHIRHYKW